MGSLRTKKGFKKRNQVMKREEGRTSQFSTQETKQSFSWGRKGISLAASTLPFYRCCPEAEVGSTVTW